MTKTKILVVDDEEDIVSLVTDILGGRYDVLTAGNVADAKALAADHSISLLITDLALPGLPGESLIQWVTSLPRRVPILVMSGFIDRQAETLKLGARDWLEKPFYAEELISKVVRLLDD